MNANSMVDTGTNLPPRALTMARAYTGAAHRHTWNLASDAPVPEEVDLPGGARTQIYRLVRQPLTGAPARDHLGHLIYVPGRYADRRYATESIHPQPATQHELWAVA